MTHVDEKAGQTTPQALAGIRICDFSGQLAGAGATKWLAAFGAEVIRIEDPVREGRWDILRGIGPYVDERRGARVRRRLQQPQHRQARHHAQPAHRARQGAAGRADPQSDVRDRELRRRRARTLGLRLRRS